MALVRLVLRIVVGALAGIVLFPAVVKAALGLIGFSAIGPVAGSIVASIQAAIGNVVAGSLFAILQSIAMGGFNVVLTVVGGIIGAIIGVIRAFFL